MQSRHYHIIKSRFRQGDFRWLGRQIQKYFAVPLSSSLGRPLAGPILGGLVITYRCNLSCVMCNLIQMNRRYRGENKEELTADELRGVIDDFVCLGISGLGITGGEPLLSKTLHDSILQTKSNGIPVSVSTNGILLDDAAAKSLLQTGVDNIHISLDAPEPSIHDDIRGHKGSFAKTVSGFKALCEEKKRGDFSTAIMCSTCITSKNYRYALDMVETGRKLGADRINLMGFEKIALGNDSTLTHRERQIRIDRDSYDEMDRIIDQFIDIKKETQYIENSVSGLKLLKHQSRGKPLPITCYAGYASLFVDCYGNIFPCLGYVEKGKYVDNIRQTSLKDLWYSDRYRRFRNRLKGCRDCYFPCQNELNLLYNYKSRLFDL